jgi:hypothetical protein
MYRRAGREILTVVGDGRLIGEMMKATSFRYVSGWASIPLESSVLQNLCPVAGSKTLKRRHDREVDLIRP